MGRKPDQTAYGRAFLQDIAEMAEMIAKTSIK